MEIRFNRPQSLAHAALRPGASVCTPWGRGVGKSHFQRAVWFTTIARMEHRGREGVNGLRGVRVVHLMPTFKACKDIHARATDEDLTSPDRWAWLGAKIDHTSWQIKFPGGSTIQWFGAREADSARGIRCDVVTVDECDDIDPAVIESVVQPWFSEPWSMATILFGGTPRRGRYGLLYREHSDGLLGDRVRSGDTSLDLTEDAREVLADKYSFHATYRDAPETVGAKRVRATRVALEAKGRLAIFKREWECDFDSAEGLVYPMFDKTFHVREAPHSIAWSEVLVGVDFGWEDPGVMLVIGVLGHGADAICWVLHEVYEPHRDTSWWDDAARAIIKLYPHARWFCDEAQPSRKADFRRLGAKVQDEPKPRIEESVGAIADRLAVRYAGNDANEQYSKLYVNPECANTIDEFGKYRRRRDPRNSDRFLDDIEDKNNHAMDSLRYPIFGRFGGPERRVIETGAGWT